MEEYYARRAAEYESIYHRDDPVRQGEQEAIVAAIKSLFRGRQVLEVACGTGYWTRYLAEVAEGVVAVDLAEETLAIARGKRLPPDRVEFRRGDAYDLGAIPGDFDAGMANFWLSHVPKARLEEFLVGFHARTGAGAVVFMADNVYLPGIGGELIVRPGAADTFKLRTLAGGNQVAVMKNYYSAGDLHCLLAPISRDLEVHVGRCFWWASYVVRLGA